MMQPVARLGDIGTRIDIEIRAGDSFSYDFVEQRDESGALIDFTGHVFSGTVSRRNDTTEGDYPLTITVLGPGAYRVAFNGSTAGWAAGDFFTPAPTYNYAVRRTAGGITTTEWFGVIHVAREAPE